MGRYLLYRRIPDRPVSATAGGVTQDLGGGAELLLASNGLVVLNQVVGRNGVPVGMHESHVTVTGASGETYDTAMLVGGERPFRDEDEAHAWRDVTGYLGVVSCMDALEHARHLVGAILDPAGDSLI